MVLLPAGLVKYVVEKQNDFAWELCDIFLSNDEEAMVTDDLLKVLKYSAVKKLADEEIMRRWIQLQPVE